MSACVEWSTSDADSIKYAPVWSPRPPNADGTDRWELFPDKLVNETRKVRVMVDPVPLYTVAAFGRKMHVEK